VWPLPMCTMSSGIPSATTTPLPAPPSGPHVNDPVGGLDNLEIVLDPCHEIAVRGPRHTLIRPPGHLLLSGRRKGRRGSLASWSALCRPSTSSLVTSRVQDVDARDEPEHDGAGFLP
jgi:hypothetical protein